MQVQENKPSDSDMERSGAVFPLRLLLRFVSDAHERRFARHCVDTYFPYAQASWVLGIVLIAGDYLVDLMVHGGGPGNNLRLTLAVPLLLGGIAYSLLPDARRNWQPVMASLIVTVALALFYILTRIDSEGGQGLHSWVGILNFTFLEFYGFVILGIQFRYALIAGLVIMSAFMGVLWWEPAMASHHAAYWSYHVFTAFLLAAGVGWWREYMLRNDFVARITLDDLRIAAERRALMLAHYDEVTGLPNRRLFTELALPIIENALHKGCKAALLHIEIERLKGVSDFYGRGQSDMILALIAQRLRVGLRVEDLVGTTPQDKEAAIVARLSDSAFTVLMVVQGHQDGASLAAQKLLDSVSQPIDLELNHMVLSASIGIAMFPGDAEDLSGLIHCSELAARASIGNRPRFFDEELNVQAKARVELEAELRAGIPEGQLRLHFQPKIDARDGRLLGAEALVRWQHPVHGLVMPEGFIGLAEQSGLIEPLTDWVLDTACQCLRQWADEGLDAVSLSVNIPASSLTDAGLLRHLEVLTQQHGVAPSCLTLELTETMLMHESASAVDMLGRLRSLGFGLSLDDFGTGYSSLSYLKRLPVSELKIDRTFVMDIGRDGCGNALAATIITLGQELGLQVVAEGVETSQQSDFLLSRGCTQQQGFLFARPVPQGRFEQMLKDGRLQRTA